MGLFNKRRFGVGLRIAMRLKGARAGLSRDEINTVIDGTTDDVIELAKEETGIEIPEFDEQDSDGNTPLERQRTRKPINRHQEESEASKEGTEAAETEGDSVDGSTVPQGADGSIIKMILEWLSSAEGQQFIKFIFSLFGFAI